MTTKIQKNTVGSTNHPLDLQPLPRYARGLDFLPLCHLAEQTGYDVVVFDLETTNFVGHRDFGIVEFGMVVAEANGRVSSATTLLNAGLPIHPIVSSKIGISNKDLFGKPSFPQISSRLRGVFARSIVSGFYSKTFDLPGLNKECQRYGLAPIVPAIAKDIREHLKTMNLASRSGKLVDIADALGVLPKGEAHHAEFDAIVTAAVASKMIVRMGTKDFLDSHHITLPHINIPKIIEVQEKSEEYQRA